MQASTQYLLLKLYPIEYSDEPNNVMDVIRNNRIAEADNHPYHMPILGHSDSIRIHSMFTAMLQGRDSSDIPIPLDGTGFTERVVSAVLGLFLFCRAARHHAQFNLSML